MLLYMRGGADDIILKPVDYCRVRSCRYAIIVKIIVHILSVSVTVVVDGFTRLFPAVFMLSTYVTIEYLNEELIDLLVGAAYDSLI